MADPSDDLKKTEQDLIKELVESRKAARAVSSALRQQSRELTQHSMALNQLSMSVQQMNSPILSSITSIFTFRSSMTAQIRSLQKQKASLDELTRSGKKLTKTQESLNTALTEKIEDTKRSMKMETWLKAGVAIGVVGAAASALAGTIRKTQKEFGISAGTSVKLRAENIKESLKTMQPGGGVFVRAEEIEQAQEDFFSEFGGVLTSTAAKNLAQEAKDLGLTTAELAKARRAFMTSTMGNISEAKKQQDRFIAEFTKKGLTSKDAMASISQYAELVARGGTRFADSMAKAAASARKMGVDLNQVENFADSIFTNFEGFLEGSAELGAMGFNLDTTRLGEAAYSGDANQFLGELQTQLKGLGKDITKLNRPERLAIEQAYGFKISDLLKLTTPEGKQGSGEKQINPLELQKKANSYLGKMVDTLEMSGEILKAISGAVFAILAVTSMRGVFGTVKDIGSAVRNYAATGSLSKTAPVAPTTTPPVPTGGTPLSRQQRRAQARLEAKRLQNAPSTPVESTVSPTSRIGTMKGGAMAGAGMGAVAGLISGVSEYQNSGSIKKALMRGLANMAGTIIGGALGSLIPIPGVGTMLGATAGGWAANFLMDKVFADDMTSKPGYGKRILQTPHGSVALNNRDTIIAYADDLSASSSGITTHQKGSLANLAMNKVAEKAILHEPERLLERGAEKGTETLLNRMARQQTVKLLAKTLSAEEAIQAVAMRGLLRNAMRGIPLVGGAVSGLATYGMDKLEGASNQSALKKATYSGIGATLGGGIGALFGGAGAIPGSIIGGLLGDLAADYFGGEKPKAGYDKNALTTPQGRVALNNNDKIIAYANDMISQNASMSILPKGAISSTSKSNVSVDMSKLEAKLDQVVAAISKMNISMDGHKVGQVVSRNLDASSTVGVLRV